MISYDEALNTILQHTQPLGRQRIRLENLLGAFLARPVVARYDMPLFDNAAVDGFGVQLADVQQASEGSPAKLGLAGVVQAGDAPNLQLQSGQTVKVLTGASVPAGVEAVIMREFCEEQNGYVYLKLPARQGENIRRRGEEFRKGHEVLPAGMLVTPPVIGLLASFGYTSYWVHHKPRVALVSTGNELVRPGKPLGKGQIYDSNSYAMAASLRNLGIEWCQVYSVRDEARSTRQVLARALKEADVVIPLGGVSVGDYDLVKEVLTNLGVEQIFWKIAMKPGKPVYFGRFQSSKSARPKLVFGLPGNPVSALVTYHQLVKPALLKMMGAQAPAPLQLQAVLAKSLKKKPARMEFVRGFLAQESGQLVVYPTIGQDSHMLWGLSKANCLIPFPTEAQVLAKDEAVPVELLGWSFH
jgi:molybdopterin molybdotransferase